MGLTEFFVAAMNTNEGFTDDPKKPAKDYMLATFLAVVVYVVVIAFVGKYLWNNYFAKYVSTVSPVDSPMDIIALSVLFGLLIPRV